MLARTQGIPIFQEQAMAIAMKLGGYTATRGGPAAPHDGQHPEEGPARGGARRDLKKRDAARAAWTRPTADEDLRGPRELRELWIS